MNRRRMGAMAGAVALSMFAGGAAVAVTTQPSTVSACTTKSGAVRLLGINVTCRDGEQKVTWNIEGEQGLPGPQGEQGPVGPQGPAGTGAKTAYVDVVVTGPVMTEEWKAANQPLTGRLGYGPFAYRYVKCPSGNAPVGVVDVDQMPSVEGEIYPVGPDVDQQAWQVLVRTGDTMPVGYATSGPVRLVCVD